MRVQTSVANGRSSTTSESHSKAASTRSRSVMESPRRPNPMRTIVELLDREAHLVHPFQIAALGAFRSRVACARSSGQAHLPQRHYERSPRKVTAAPCARRSAVGSGLPVIPSPRGLLSTKKLQSWPGAPQLVEERVGRVRRRSRRAARRHFSRAHVCFGGSRRPVFPPESLPWAADDIRLVARLSRGGCHRGGHRSDLRRR